MGTNRQQEGAVPTGFAWCPAVAPAMQLLHVLACRSLALLSAQLWSRCLQLRRGKGRTYLAAMGLAVSAKQNALQQHDLPQLLHVYLTASKLLALASA